MANRRFEMHDYRQILGLMRSGQSDRTIGKSGLVGRKKAGELREIAEACDWLNLDTPLPEDAVLAKILDPPSENSLNQVSLVAPYHEEVEQWAMRGIYGTTIHDALVRKYGFEGSYSSVRRYLQGLKGQLPEATTVLEFQPGEAAQIDFGTGPRITDVFTGEIFSTWFFVMTLAWSRHMYAELVRDQKVETWLLCHQRAFEFFGGVPLKTIIDNPKCAITKACYYDPTVQRAYWDAAEGYGFLISPCPPRSPEKKGRVESGVKYLKRSFMPLREFRTLTDGNQQLKAWVLETAGNRIHGTTKQRPLDLFETERHVLKPLPDSAPELAVWGILVLQSNCHVQFEKCYYSAPFSLVRKKLWLKASSVSVKIFYNYDLVALHPRLRRPGSRSTIPEHMPPDAVAYAMKDPQWCLRQAEQIGIACHKVIQSLFANRVLDKLKSAHGVIGLGSKFGPGRLEAACERALAFDEPNYTTVKTILHKGLDQVPMDTDTFQNLSGAYTGKGHFSRNIPSLFESKKGDAS